MPTEQYVLNETKVMGMHGYTRQQALVCSTGRKHFRGAEGHQTTNRQAEERTAFLLRILLWYSFLKEKEQLFQVASAEVQYIRLQTRGILRPRAGNWAKLASEVQRKPRVCEKRHLKST